MAFIFLPRLFLSCFGREAVNPLFNNKTFVGQFHKCSLPCLYSHVLFLDCYNKLFGVYLTSMVNLEEGSNMCQSVTPASSTSALKPNPYIPMPKVASYI